MATDLRPPQPPGLMPPAKKKGYFFAKASALLLLTTGGAGYYAYTLRGDRETKDRSLIAAATARDICEQKLDKAGKDTLALGGAAARNEADAAREKAARESAEKGLTASQTTLEATQAELGELRRQRVEVEKRLAAFRELTAKFQKMIDTGRLEIVVRDGRMIVKLPAGVLFDSGNAELSRDGQMALMEVALVLRDLPDRKFMVVGHTDNVPLKNSVYSDNWALSAARALNVIRFLVTTGIKPENLLAAGYGEFDPIKTNKSDGGRKANRRIEIVLLPNVSEMPPVPAEMADKPAPDAPDAPPPAAPAAPAAPVVTPVGK
jgi:chemotaxis protein MotB